MVDCPLLPPAPPLCCRRACICIQHRCSATLPPAPLPSDPPPPRLVKELAQQLLGGDAHRQVADVDLALLAVDGNLLLRVAAWQRRGRRAQRRPRRRLDARHPHDQLLRQQLSLQLLLLQRCQLLLLQRRQLLLLLHLRRKGRCRGLWV